MSPEPIDSGLILFFRIILAEILTQVIVFVTFSTSKDGIFHLSLYTVDVVLQTLLICFCGSAALLDNPHNIRYLLRTLSDGITKCFPLPFLLNLTVLTTYSHQTECRQDY